jgi:hypothetical protein
VSPVGLLTFDGSAYSFAYLVLAPEVEGFTPLLGFPHFKERYTSTELFPLFAQRAMDPRRPDFERYVTDLGLPASSATPWEQISRSTGARGSDTLQLFPAPMYEDDHWVCHFLVTGIRHLLEKDVTFRGSLRSRYSSPELEATLSELSEGSELWVEHEVTNRYSSTALLAGHPDGRPVGWLPNWLASEVLQLQADGKLAFVVDRVNPAEAGWHMRVVVRMQASCARDYNFFSGPNWQTLA